MRIHFNPDPRGVMAGYLRTQCRARGALWTCCAGAPAIGAGWLGDPSLAPAPHPGRAGALLHVAVLLSALAALLVGADRGWRAQRRRASVA